MTLKKQHTLKRLDETEVDQTNQLFDEAYRSKIEGRVHTDSSAVTTVEAFQFIETGEIEISATGSAITTSVPFQNTLNKLLFAGANVEVDGLVVSAHNVTASSMSLTVRGNSAVVSDVITASFSVRWMLIGSAP